MKIYYQRKLKNSGSASPGYTVFLNAKCLCCGSVDDLMLYLDCDEKILEIN